MSSNNKIPIFISWSGTLAESFAQAFRESIRDLIGDYAKPFLSKEDIPDGETWHSVIMSRLKETKYGIVILTPDSLQKPWVHFEAGAIAMTLEESSWLPLLVGVKKINPIISNSSPYRNYQIQEFDPENNGATRDYLKKIVERVIELYKGQVSDIKDTDLNNEADELHSKLKKAFEEWQSGFKTHLPKVELVNYSEKTKRFDNFTGEYIAFNAPLAYEEGGENPDALNAHLNRYRKRKVRAEYFYPIFVILEKNTFLQWLHSIQGFFKRLNQGLDDDERKLLLFHVPEFKNHKFTPQFDYDIGFTFFLGKKQDDSNIVYIYMHNRIYSVLSATSEPLVKKYFVIRDEVDFELHKRFIKESQFRSMKGMKKMDINSFLEYCNEITVAYEQEIKLDSSEDAVEKK